MSDIVSVGESTALLSVPQVGRLRDTRHLDLSIAGAESNVAIGVARLGHRASWIGRVGDDEFGELIVKVLRGEAVDVSGVVVDPERQTGLMLKERRAENVVQVTYYRRGYAGSALSSADLDEDLIAAAQILHVTGITLALSDSARAAILRAVEIARSAGVTVSFDVNYRSRLWSRDDAKEVIGRLAPLVDIFFAGDDELFVLGDNGLADARALAEGGRRDVVIKRGARGAMSLTSEGELSEPAVAVHAIDPVGAGDCFVAGYLAARLEGRDAHGRLATACATGAFAASMMGDWECAPRRDDLELLLRESGTTLR